MMRVFFKYFMTLFFAVFAISVHAQDNSDLDWETPDLSYNCLGIHHYVSVDLDNDPVESGYLKYTIPVPKEGIDFITGPAGCHLLNNLGSTIDVYVRRSHLELALADQPYAQVRFELFVRLWKDYNGITTTILAGIENQCYYLVIFNMSNI